MKWSSEPARGEDVPAAIARAYYVAMQQPCGPTFVSIPVDDWERSSEAIPPRTVSRLLHPDPALIETIGARLDRSARPVFVVGPGVDRNGAWEQVVALAERHQALVWVSPMSPRCSFPERHRLFAGFLPAIRERIVEEPRRPRPRPRAGRAGLHLSHRRVRPARAARRRAAADGGRSRRGGLDARRHRHRLRRPARQPRRCCSVPPRRRGPHRRAGARRRGSSRAIASRSRILMQTLAETCARPTASWSKSRRRPRHHAGPPADRAAAQLLHLRQRRPGPQPAGGGRGGAGHRRRAAA